MTDGRVLVSVVMPVRDESGAIDDAVGSVLAQTHGRVEVLVVDGRSGDDTRARVRALAARDPRVRLLDNPRRVIPSALNVGLAAARGSVLARVDGHARVGEDYLARGVAILAARPEVAAVGGRRIGVAGTPAGRAVALALASRLGVGNSLNHYAMEATDTDHASFPVYRTEVLRAVGGWDEGLLANEDVDLDHRVLEAGHRIAYDPDMAILWHVRESVRALGRQYRRYGRGKAAMVRKNGPSALAARHLAAPLLIGLLATAGIVAATGRRRTAAVLIAPYAGAIAVGAARAWRRRGPDGPTSAPTLPLALITMHLTWGFGFLEGLLAGRGAAAGSVSPQPAPGAGAPGAA